jgi:hypothetical protein
VRGSIAAQGGDGLVTGGCFFPSGLKRFAIERSVRLMAGPRLFACLDCHLVWSNAIPGHLEQLIASQGTEALLQSVASADQGET